MDADTPLKHRWESVAIMKKAHRDAGRAQAAGISIEDLMARDAAAREAEAVRNPALEPEPEADARRAQLALDVSAQRLEMSRDEGLSMGEG